MDRSSHRLGRKGLPGLTVVLALSLSHAAVAQTGTPPIPPATSAAAVVDLVSQPPVLEVRKVPAVHAARRSRRHLARARHHEEPLDRPALAGVLLVEPIPEPVEPPRPIVPMPAFFIDGLASDLTTPPPPVVCEPARRDRSLPDPHLRREVPLVCRYDVE